MALDYTQFYLMNRPLTGRRPPELKLSLPDPMESARLIARGLAAKDGTPLPIKVQRGKNLPDIMVTDVHLPLLHERIFALFKDHKFTGWKHRAVNLTGVGADVAPTYGALIVKGRAGRFDLNLARDATELPPVSQGNPGPAKVGCFFPPESWDQSDIFMMEGTSTVVVTRRVRDVLIEARATGITLTRADLEIFMVF